MKKLIQINTVCNGSTGRIMYQIQKAAQNQGYTTLSIYGRRSGYSDVDCAKYGNVFSFWHHVALTTLFDAHGFGSYIYTKKIVKRLRIEQPDIIHLHNVHGYYLHLPTLFHYFKTEYTGKLVWTLHDCWPLTGHCPHFTIAQCDKWKQECNNCPNKKYYPISLGLDSSRRNFKYKKKLFTEIDNLTLTCPSFWLKNIVEHSFMRDTKCVVVPNGIDLNVFYPRKEDTVIPKYNIPYNKKIILGVASIWDPRKGLNDFIQLAQVLSPDYVIVLVGLSQKQILQLPNNIIGIPRTESTDELAQLYTKAAIFINPSKEESFSLVTVEAMACGTPVIAMDTSAPRELVNEKNGVLLSNNSINNYLQAIRYIEEKKWNEFDIINSVLQYSIEQMTNKMLEIYTD